MKMPLLYKMLNLFMLLIITMSGTSCHERSTTISEKEKEIPENDPFIKNSTFESTLSDYWISEGWQQDKGNYSLAKGEGINHSKALSLSATAENDIWVKQKIKLKPDQVYRLKAWVKTRNVTGGYGANICIADTWIRSTSLKGTKDWTQLSLQFFTPDDSDQVTVACRLGYWNSTSSGTAFFDNLTLENVQLFEAQSKHIRIRLDPEDVQGIARESISAWLNNLDKVYEAYTELIGERPWDGKRITILSVEQNPGGWAVAGNPILWYQPYVKSTLDDVVDNSDWSFGILHELGHDFSPHIGMNLNNNWNWNEEMFANFRMFYAVDKLNIPIRMVGKNYIGKELANLFKTDAADSYDNTLAKGIARGHDGLMYTLIRIQEMIGWEPFKKVYRYLYHSDVNPSNNWEKFSFFLDQLSEYSGKDVKETYPEGELDLIKEQLQ